MRRSKQIVISVLLFVFMLTGCWRSYPIQALAFVTAIGLDYKDGKFIVYNQVLNFRNVAKVETSTIGEEVPVWIGRGEGRTLGDALSNISATSQLRTFYGHVRVIVCTENFLKQNRAVRQVYDAFNRFREIRYNIYLYGTKISLTEILATKSILNLNPLNTVLDAPEATYAKRSIIPPIYGYKFIVGFDESGRRAILPSLTISRDTWTEDEKKKGVMRVNGAYLFSGGQYNGWFPENELLGIRWLNRQTEANLISVSDGQSPYAALILGKPRYRIIPYMENDKLKYRIHIKVSGFIEEMNRTKSIPTIEKDAAKVLQNEVIATFRKGVAKQTDVLGLQGAAYRKQHASWKKLKRQGELSLTEDSLTAVHVKVKIKHTGKYKGVFRQPIGK